MNFTQMSMRRKPPSHGELLKVLAALEMIAQAGLLGELQDRIEADCRLDRQEAYDTYSISRPMYRIDLLRRTIGVPADAAEDAAEDYLRPSPSRTSYETTMQLAAEIEAARRPAQSAEQSRSPAPRREPPKSKRRLVA
jgi:hypothetical protein